MKKLFKVLGIAAAIAMVLGFAGCSDDSYDEAVVQDNLHPMTNVEWDIENWASAPRGITGATTGTPEVSYMEIAKTNSDAKNGSLFLSGKLRFDTTKKALVSSNSTSTTADNYTALGASGVTMELKLAATSAVTIRAGSAGSDKADYRWLVIANDDGKVALKKVLADGSLTTAVQEYVVELAAGTWKIYGNSTVISYIKAKSDTWDPETKYIINTAAPTTPLEKQTYLGIVGDMVLPGYDTAIVAVSFDKKAVVKGDETKYPVVVVKAKKVGKTEVVITNKVDSNGLFSSAKFEVVVESDGTIKPFEIKKIDFANLEYDLTKVAITDDVDQWLLAGELTDDADTVDIDESVARIYLTGLGKCFLGDEKDADKVRAAKQDVAEEAGKRVVVSTKSNAKEKIKVRQAENISTATLKTGDCLEIDAEAKLKALMMGTATVEIADSASNKQTLTVTVAEDGSMTFKAGTVAPYEKGKSAKVNFIDMAKGTTIKKITSISQSYGRVVEVEPDVSAGTEITADDIEKTETNGSKTYKGITITAKKAGTATVTVEGEFVDPDDASKTVDGTAVISVTVGADGYVTASVSPHYAYPFYYENGDDGKVTNIYSMKLTEALAAGDKFGAKAADLGKAIDGTAKVEYHSASMKVEKQDKATWKIGEEEKSFEYRLATGASTDNTATAAHYIKLSDLSVGDYVFVAFTSGGDDKRGVYINNARGKVLDSAEVSSSGKTDFQYMIHRIVAGDLDNGATFLNYSKSVYIYAFEIYKDKE